MTNSTPTPVVILDFGSQFTQLIARMVRECGVFCEIVPYHIDLEKLRDKKPKALILSGGPASVSDKSSPKLNKMLLDWEVPILGICYGMQILSHLKKGKVGSRTAREYGACKITIEKSSGLFKGFKEGEACSVWMSHGDSVEKVPKDCKVSARSEKCIVAIEKGNLHAVQFHPEVAHTEIGKRLFKNFLFEIAKLSPVWKIENVLEHKAKEIVEKVGESEVIGGISGGVDSTILAVFLSQVL
jgi:GMP synthase (glutamine-hydrolysing)